MGDKKGKPAVNTPGHISKQIVLLLLLSLIATFSLHILDDMLKVVVVLHDHLASMLQMIFAGSEIGHLVQAILSMVLIPIGVGLLAFSGYYLVKKKPLTLTMDIVWAVWLVTLIVLALQLG